MAGKQASESGRGETREQKKGEKDSADLSVNVEVLQVRYVRVRRRRRRRLRLRWSA